MENNFCYIDDAYTLDVIRANISTTPNTDFRYTVTSATATTFISNATNYTTYVTLYYWKSRRDIPFISATYDNWNDVFVSLGGAQEASFSTHDNYIGFTPFQNYGWCSYMKCYKSKRLKLLPGECHTATLTRKKSREFTWSVLKPSFIFAMKGAKVITMTAHTMPVNDVTTKSTVSVGTAGLNYLTTFRYKYTWIQDISNSNFYTNVLSTTLSGRIMEYFTDTAVAEITS